jgi:diguanylate cyclase (GGDEF)-like protein
MALLDAENLPALLERLTDGLRRSFRLQATTVAIVDRDREIQSLLGSVDTDPAQLTQVMFVDAVGDLAPQLRARLRPWLGPFVPADHERLFAGTRSLQSVALLPLVRRARIVGSLHFASHRAARFTREHATDFLHHLGIMAAFGLENAINRAKLVRTGFTDALTGWHNRAYLELRLKEALARSQRARQPLVCLMLDIDHFKQVNDTHGHAVGDAVLREVAQRINGQVRSSDLSARYGGEEFIVLLPDTGLEAGHLLAERIRATVSGKPFGVDRLDVPLPVTVSIGLAEYRPRHALEDPGRIGERLIAQADGALYESKAAGRNAVTLAPREAVG